MGYFGGSKATRICREQKTARIIERYEREQRHIEELEELKRREKANEEFVKLSAKTFSENEILADAFEMQKLEWSRNTTCGRECIPSAKKRIKEVPQMVIGFTSRLASKTSVEWEALAEWIDAVCNVFGYPHLKESAKLAFERNRASK